MTSESKPSFWGGPWKIGSSKYEYVLNFTPFGRIGIVYREDLQQYRTTTNIQNLVGGFGPYKTLEEAKRVGIECALGAIKDRIADLNRVAVDLNEALKEVTGEITAGEQHELFS